MPAATLQHAAQKMRGLWGQEDREGPPPGSPAPVSQPRAFAAQGGRRWRATDGTCDILSPTRRGLPMNWLQVFQRVNLGYLPHRRGPARSTLVVPSASCMARSSSPYDDRRMSPARFAEVPQRSTCAREVRLLLICQEVESIIKPCNPIARSVPTTRRRPQSNPCTHGRMRRLSIRALLWRPTASRCRKTGGSSPVSRGTDERGTPPYICSLIIYIMVALKK